MSLSRKVRRARQRDGAGGEKMAVVLTDVAMPLLQQVPDGDHEGYEMALKVGLLLWNASRVKDEQAREKTITDLVNLADKHGAPGIESLCREVIARAELLYPHEERLIVRVKVDRLPGGRYNVMTTSGR